MAKFALSLLPLLLLLASTTAAVEILNPSSRCSREIDRQRLSSCRQYLKEGSRFDWTREGESSRGWREAFPRCCDELERINQQCRCEAVKQVVREHQSAGVQGQQMREMLQTAQSLPSLCRISPQYCDNIGQSTTMI
ncbi:2S albumin seed storage protein-like [Salvia divinorum]|uniref:2S albumin seed storage protein-like n=1 Tax=Salvia divinorum TaxID=28513 RepID=A0ABD1G5F8_SALDI